MTGLEAELDLASIDKVDVRNELRRFTLLRVLAADFQKLGPYCKPKVCPITIRSSRWGYGPARPARPARPCHFVTLSRKKMKVVEVSSEGVKIVKIDVLE